MKTLFQFALMFLCLTFLGCSTEKDENDIDVLTPNGIYFPPNNTDDWDTKSPKELGWNTSKEENLYNYLESKNTKGFIILKNGRIVIEKYFNGHAQNTEWLWNSAAKTLTAATVGIAQDENLLSISKKTSNYLGNNWSSLELNKEDLITVEHHLNMTTGLTDHVGSFIKWSCTAPSCFTYEADAGTRWAYHQGAYTIIKDIVEEAVGDEFNTYFYSKIRDKIGMSGAWEQQTILSLFSSNTRSMARWGLLIQNEGEWNSEQIISKTFFNQMTTSSQSLNPSYGFLWWLNGQGSFMNTTSQVVFNGSLVPNAPSDMYAALGADDQKIYIVPSKELVIVRCGESAEETQLGPSSFDNELWAKINEVID